MTDFFIPGHVGDARSVEDTYGEMRRQIELDLGRPPSARRIFRLWARRGPVDCVTEVGGRDPLHGGTVVAIFDMGPHDPYVVCWQQELGSREGVREILACHAYAVVEFER